MTGHMLPVSLDWLHVLIGVGWAGGFSLAGLFAATSGRRDRRVSTVPGGQSTWRLP